MHTSNAHVQGLNKSAPRNKSRLVVARDENESLLSADQAKDLFLLDAGRLINRVHRGRRALPGMVAGTPNGQGYLCVRVNTINYRVHRLVWLITYGRWPEGQIDHINGVRDDNRIENLREVSVQENQRNTHIRIDNTSGVTGVSKELWGWRARIKVGGKKINIGFFKSFDDAVAARKKAEAELGFHPNHGRTDAARRNGMPSFNLPRTQRTS